MIKSSLDGVVDKASLFGSPQILTDMATAKTPDPLLRTFPDRFIVARKPIVRKPVPHTTKTDNSDELREEVKNTALEALLLLFALGAFGACTVCFVVMELLSRM